MSKADVSAGRAFVSLFMKDQLTKPLRNAQKQLTEFGSGLLSIGSKVAGMGAAIAGGLTAAVMHFANVGSDLNDMSARTGISTTGLVELGYAAEQTGTDMETLEGGVRKMQQNLGGIGPESKTAVASLAAMGIQLRSLKGLSPEDQFQAIAERIGSIEDPSRRAAAAMAIFGKNKTTLLPMMEGIRALREEARELGIAPSPESIKAADMLGDTIDKVRKVVGAAFFEIGAAVAPMAQSILEGFLRIAKAVKKFVSENGALIRSIAMAAIGLMAAGSAIAAIGAAFVGAGMVISGFLSVLSAVSAVAGVVSAVLGAILSPIGLLIAALGVGVYAWLRFTESGKSFAAFVTSTFGGILTTVKDTFGGITDAIMGGDLVLAGQIAMTGLRLVFAQALDAIHSLFGETFGTIAGQVLSGDFVGAFATSGGVILGIWSTVTTGISAMMLNAMAGIKSGWIITARSFGDAWDIVVGGMGGSWSDFQNTIAEGMVNAIAGFGGGTDDEIIARERDLKKSLHEEQAAQKQASTTRMSDRKKESDEKLIQVQKDLEDSKAVLEEELKASLAATQQGPGRTKGKSAEASAEVTRIQAELDALRKTAAEKADAVKSGKGSRTGDAAGDRMGELSMGKASAATFNLGSLNTAAGGQLQATLGTKKAVEMAAKQAKENADKQVAAIEKTGLHHS